MPTDAIIYLTVDEALAIHDRLVRTFGGPAGVRDLGLLESALFRPQTGYYEDIAQMAAALFESLVMNHAFVDGNKRIAFFATDVFLRLNGWKLEVDADAAHARIVGLLEQGRCDFQNLLSWIQDSLSRKE